MKKLTVFALLAVTVLAVGAQAAFVVEPHSSGKAFGNFAGTPRYSTGLSTAIGLTATSSAYGNTGAFPDVYVFSYTPGVDLDNTVLTAGTDLGNGDLASGLVGGGSGRYNVYITWCLSDNVTALADITVTNDGANVVSLGVDMDNVNAAQSDTVVSAGMNKWLRIAENVSLTAGVKYTVTQSATADTWTSMRSSGVMWEMVPEPTTMLLLGIGGLVMRIRRSR